MATIIEQCKDPWLYWWLLITREERKRLVLQHFPSQQFPFSRQQKKIMWEAANSPPVTDDEWLQLAEACIHDPIWPPPINRREIWRQVYRIASAKL